MKSAKKLAGILLALVMVFSLAAPVFATQEGSLTGGSITIENPVEDARYDIYQILYLESYNAAAGAYSYKANSAWADWLATQTTYVSIDANGYVTWVKDADVAAFAKAALAYAESKNMTPDATQTATKAADGSLKVEFTDLKLGYYLVDTTVGTICSLDTTNPKVTIEDKNGVPQSDKLVKEDSDNSWGKKNDADIGQTVEFKGVITAGVGAENYVYHDKMSAGLTYTGVTKVEITTAADKDTTTVVNPEYYTVTSTGLTDGCTFEVAFTQEFCDTLKSGDVVTIYYTAVLNENAVVGTPGNPNESHLSYGDSGKPGSTPTSETKTYTWEFKVFKYTMKSETETALAGAVFSLYRDEACTDIIKLVKVSDNVYRVATDNDDSDTVITQITTDATGKFTIQGLDSDTYYLKEITPPAGFNELKDPIKVVITDNGKVNPTEENANGVEYVKVLNQTGSELPSTGGVGTTILYIVGGVLVIAAVVLLVTKKRMSNS